MKNFFNDEELQALEALEIKGGANGSGTATQYECVNSIAYRGGGVLQNKCSNTAEKCGLIKDPELPVFQCVQNPL